jgi:hypothetical protein
VWRIVVVLLLGAAVIVGCDPTLGLSDPAGWTRHAAARPTLSIAVPPEFQRRAGQTENDLRFGTAAHQLGGLLVIREWSGPTERTEWAAWAVEAFDNGREFPPGEWVDLPAGRTWHATTPLGDLYAFPPRDGATIVLLFPFNVFRNEQPDLVLNRRIAATVRFGE